MGPGEVALSYGYPLILLAGTINIPSLVYLLAFAVTTIWSPHPLLPKRKILVNVVNWILTIYSGLICLGHIVFQAVLASQPDYGVRFLPITGTLTTVLQFVGFQRITDVGEGFRLITADVVVFIASAVFVALLKRNIVYSKEYESYARTHPLGYIPTGPSTTNGLAILALLLLNGLAFASGLQSVYFIVFQAALVANAFMRLNLATVMQIMFYPMLTYDLLHILGIYVSQADPIRTRIPLNWSNSLGLKYVATDITPVPLMGVTICLSWASSIFLLILLAFRKRNSDLRALEESKRDYLNGNSHPSTKLHQRDSAFWKLVRRFVRAWGWRICTVGLLAVALVNPNFFSAVLLFAVCVASVVPQILLERYHIIPSVTVYIILTTTAQYIYNIPNVGKTCSLFEKSVSCAFGFNVYDYTWFQIGLETVVCALLAINWGFYSSSDPTLLEDEENSHSYNRTYLSSSSRRSGRMYRKSGEYQQDQIVDHGDDGMESEYDQNVDHDDTTHLLAEHNREDDHVRHVAAPSSGPKSNARSRKARLTDSSGSSTSSSRRRKHARDASFMSFLSYGSDFNELAGGIDAEAVEEKGKKKAGCCGRCVQKLSSWWRDFRPILKAVGFWALKQSYLLCLCGVYVAGLHQVTLLNAVYLLILILFLISPRIARRFWLGLVLYCEFVILLVYTWSATPWTTGIKATDILGLIGLQSYETTDLLFTKGLVWHLVIMLFAVIQLWVLRYTAKLTKEGKDKPTEKIPRWMRSVGDMFFWAWDEYGLIPVYTVLVVVASMDRRISLINILYITLLFVCLTIHMLTRKADIHIKRWWIFVVVASGVILIARYAYQFDFVSKFLAQIIPYPDLILAIGFEDFKSVQVFVPLLGNTFVFLVGVVQLQTFFAKKEETVGVGHNAHAQRLVDFEAEDSTMILTDYSDFDDGARSTGGSSRPSSLPSSFKFGRVMAPEDTDTDPSLPQPPVHYFSAEDSPDLADRISSGRSERPISASTRLVMDEELLAEDIARHPTSTLSQRKKRLRRKHVWEALLYTLALDLVYWLKRFCMLHMYKIAALVMIAVCIKNPSGLNSVYVEIVILSVSADHLTDGVGLLLLIYTQLTVLFSLVYQFQAVHDGLSAYLPLVGWAGFEFLPENRFSLIASKMGIIIVLLVQRFSHRWKNDWYRIKKAEILTELEPSGSLNSEAHFASLSLQHLTKSPSLVAKIQAGDANLTGTNSMENTKLEDLPQDPSDYSNQFNLHHAVAESKYGILQQLHHLMKEDDRDNDQIESLKKQYLHKTELTLFLYDSSEELVMKDTFNWKEAWNVVAWYLSNAVHISGYPILVAALLLTVLVHKETVYGIIFLLILGLTIITKSVRWTCDGAPIKILTVYVALELLVQYILNLDLPPPDLRYPWSTWDSQWLSWLGLKQMNQKSGVLIADFVLLLVVSRIRRISADDLKRIHYDRYWHYLAGPVVKFRESKTWRDSIRYSVYRFSPFVILLLIFIAGTIRPDILSLIYVFFALLFIFRESTIYAKRNKIWRFARLYNYLLMLVILAYQLPAIPASQSAMSAAEVIGLRKGGSILFSVFIFVLLGIQKRLFSRVEFDELVLSILDEEEKGVKLAQERFQEWKMIRRAEFQRVQEEKLKRRQQLDFLKAARTRQQKIWQRLAKGTEQGGSNRASMALGSHGGTLVPGMIPAGTPLVSGGPAMPPVQGMPPAAMYPSVLPSYSDYVSDPRMRTMTSRDLKLLQSQGGLSIEEDPTSHHVKLKFKTPTPIMPPTQTPIASSSAMAYASMDPTGTSSLVPESGDDEIVVPPRALSPNDSERDPDHEEDEDTEDAPLPALVSDEEEEEEEEDVLASALQQPRATGEDDLEIPKCCSCWKTPQWLITAADYLIAWLDKHTDGYLATKPHYSRPRKLWGGFYKLYQINSAALCYLFFLINCAVNADIISLFYPLSMFLYALLETPRPHKLYWNTVFVYASITILVKFFYQISIFCVCRSGDTGLQHWALASTCHDDPTCFAPATTKKGLASTFKFSAPRVIGITSYRQEQGGNGRSFIAEIVPDLLVLISVFLHRYWLKKLGYWNFVQRLTLSKEGSDEPMSQKQLSDEAKRFEQILLKQQKKREQWTRYAAEKKKRRWAKQMAKLGDSVMEGMDENGEMRDPELGGIPIVTSGPSTMGLKVVTNPLFKAGESDFETDAEEMTSPKSPGTAQKVRFEDSSGAPRLNPDISTPIIHYSSGGTYSGTSFASSSAASSSSGTTGLPSLVVGTSVAAAESHSARRRLDASSTFEDDEETIMVGKRLSESSDSEESGEERGTETSSSSSSFEEDEYDEEDENLYAESRSKSRRRAFNNFRRWGKSRAMEFVHFFQNVVAHKPGRELYVQIWFIELVCFFFILILPSPFIGNSAGNVADFLSQSRLPNAYVLTLLGQFILIVIERVLYLYRAMKLKLIYHCLLVAFYHIWLLFVAPVFSGADYRSQAILIAFYLLKLVYLYLSSLQIMYGYPDFVQGQFLTDSNEPGIIRWLIYTAYRAIPFVYELRTLLDWTVTRTSLTFFEWLKLEDIYANLFLVKCRVSQDKVWERNVGDAQAWYVKLGMGVLLFVGLAALIWFPLLLLMQGSPGNQDNPIIAASVSIGFTGYATPIYTAVAVGQTSIKGKGSLSQDLFNELRLDQPAITYDDYNLIQWIEFENFSDAGWSISPPAKQHLILDLLSGHSIQMSVHVGFTRKFAISTGQVANYDYPVNIEQPWEVVKAINGSSPAFLVEKLLPRYYRIPNSGDATPLNSDGSPGIGANFSLSHGAEPYWNLKAVPTQGSNRDAFPWDNTDRLQLVTFSAEAPKGLLRSLASVGLIGLYVGVVLAVARFLRLSITDLAFRIIYEDMPACEELISYCEDIYMARQDGDLVLEEELFRELVEIYRSPETIIGRTVRTHPRFAGRELTDKEKKKLAKLHADDGFAAEKSKMD